VSTATAAAHPSEFRAALQRELPRMLALLERLVNTDSGSYDRDGVNRVATMLADELASIGFAIDRRPMPHCGDQTVAERRLGGKGRLLILGHADTVWPKGTAAEWPFAMADGCATGPGVGDMKGGLVMAIFALRVLLARGFDALESIRFFIVPDEELGSIHSRPRIEEVAREADWTLVLEPGRPGGGVVTARGALGAFFMHAHGKSAHCAVNYRQGASAVRELAAKVPLLDGLSDPDRGMVVNVGVFQGGAARQVSPPEAKIDIDLRARSTEDADHLLSRIRAIAEERRDPRVTVDLTGRMTRPPFTVANNRALFGIAQDVAAALELPLFEVDPTGGGSDGNFSAALGVPTLDGLGPITTDTCGRGETIDVASLAGRGALFASIVERLGRQ
jgi:glutamate carboxypeptidase